MKLFTQLIDRSAITFNELGVWSTECKVWGQCMASASFDRWLYLRLHRMGRMGVSERATLQKIVRPGMTVLDIGGNLGLYTVLLSRLVGPTGRVISFEPDPDLFALLKKNCALNDCVNVEAHNLALGRRRDRLILRKMIINSGDNTLGRGGAGRFRREIEIDVVSLDEFLPGLTPDLIKIDVQGWELEALRGMQGILSGNACVRILFEFWPAGFQRAGYAAEQLVSFIHDQGFTLHAADTQAELNQQALTQLSRELTGLRHVDLLALRK